MSDDVEMKTVYIINTCDQIAIRSCETFLAGLFLLTINKCESDGQQY